MKPTLFASKASSLAYLAPLVQGARILPLYCFHVRAWTENPTNILQELENLPWSGGPMIVRSSAGDEDRLNQSNAGHYLSVGDVIFAELAEVIERVIASYGTYTEKDQVFVQPFLSAIELSGVLFSHEPSTGAPYVVINYDNETERTDTVTSGCTNTLRTRLIHRSQLANSSSDKFGDLLGLLKELEGYIPRQPLDVEFARDKNHQLYLLQVRPLNCEVVDESRHTRQLKQVEQFVAEHMRPHPYLLGSRTVLGIMPDWNPAEIIGVRPRPLARSLYQELVTDAIWAYQRDNYGYRNLRSFPLMLSLMGCPYIDVRVSFNSFLPADLSDTLAEKLVDFYLSELVQRPDNHDKVEFEVIYSCYTLDLPDRLKKLSLAGFSETEQKELSQSLQKLTRSIINPRSGFWKQDITKIEELERRWSKLDSESMSDVSRIYWLLEDCKRYGTLPFAGLARAGFIAVQMLHALVSLKILSDSEYQLFMRSLDTVSSAIQQDLHEMKQEEFLNKYGHLRPGTYDILSQRYDESPELYFSSHVDHQREAAVPERFALSLEQLNQIQTLLDSHELGCNVLEMFAFIKAAIEGREYAKFVFTRHLSGAMQTLIELGQSHDLDREALSYLDIKVIQRLYAGASNPKTELQQSIQQGQQAYQQTAAMVLPPLITDPESIWEFELYADTPNYITLKKAVGAVCVTPQPDADLTGKIVFIPQADPGYDWLFSRSIMGLVTCFGGVNSHMAIRSAELGLPAVIGAGQVLFDKWSQARYLEIDCANQQVKVL